MVLPASSATDVMSGRAITTATRRSGSAGAAAAGPAECLSIEALAAPNAALPAGFAAAFAVCTGFATPAPFVARETARADAVRDRTDACAIGGAGVPLPEHGDASLHDVIAAGGGAEWLQPASTRPSAPIRSFLKQSLRGSLFHARNSCCVDVGAGRLTLERKR